MKPIETSRIPDGGWGGGWNVEYTFYFKITTKALPYCIPEN